MNMKITTPAMSHARIIEMEDILFSDFHKDVYGYRPRETEWDSWVNMSAEGFNYALEAMFIKIENDEKQRKIDQEDALIKLRLDLKMKLAELRATSPQLSPDWTDAFCMIMQEEISSNDVSFFLWRRGINQVKSSEIEEKYYASI